MAKIEKVEEAKDIIKQKIASDISEQAKQFEPISDDLKESSQRFLRSKKEKGSSMLASLAESAENFMEDVVDSAKAILLKSWG